MIGAAVQIAKIATGEIEENLGATDEGKGRGARTQGWPGGQPEQEAAVGDRQKGRREAVGWISGRTVREMLEKRAKV